MRNLNQHTANVLDEINEAEQPALITRRGRPVALIIPLMNSEFESRALSLALQDWQEQERPSDTSADESSDDVAERLGPNA